MANFPVKAERIYDTSEAPAVFFTYWDNLGGTGFQRASEGGIRVRDDEYHSDRAAADNFRGGVDLFRGFAAYPKECAIYCEFRDYGAGGIFQAMALDRSERCFVKFDGSRAISN